MAFFGLFRDELDESKLLDHAHRFLEGLRQGLSEAEAIARSGADFEDLRQWRRNPAFRAAARRAPKERGPRLWGTRPPTRMRHRRRVVRSGRSSERAGAGGGSGEPDRLGLLRGLRRRDTFRRRRCVQESVSRACV